MEPRLLRQAGIDAESALLASLIQAVKADRKWIVTSFDAEQYRSEAAHATTLADSLDLLTNVFPKLAIQTEEIIARLQGESEQYENLADEEDPPEPEYDSEDSRERSPSQFDIDGLFADL